MASITMKRARAGCRNFAAVMLILYFYQTFPHDHSEFECSDHQIDFSSIHEAHHSTPCELNEHMDGTDCPCPMHQHDLALHIDSHLPRAKSHDMRMDGGQAVQAERSSPEYDDTSVQARLNDLEISIPESVPIAPLRARSPPLWG